MNVLFVYPNVKGQLGFHYGLASLSAVLKRAGHRTALLNLNEAWEPLPSPEEFRARVRAFSPGLVGFSVVTPQHKYASSLAAEVKRAGAYPVVFGGVHATMVPEEVAADPSVDYVCVGEGEEALLELVRALGAGGDTTGIRNLWAKRGGAAVRNPVRPLGDFAELPMPDHELFDFQRFTDAKGGWVGLMASRGCPFRCSYCFNHRMVERYCEDLGVKAGELGYVRRLPVDRVIAEIEHLLKTYAGIRMFLFDDDLFTHDPDYVVEFCRRYARVSKVPITVNAHVMRFDARVAGALRAAGCRQVKFGLESGSPRIRKEVMNRPMSDDRIASAFDCAHGAGLVTSAFVMMGLPRETPADLEKTFDLLGRIRPGRMRWSTFFPFPGTRAYEMAAADGSLDAARMRGLDNFFGESCLDLGPEMNRLVQRSRWLFPWSVNARLPGPTGKLYASLVETFRAMPEAAFEEASRDFRRLDAEVAGWAASAGGDPYRIRYNDFMAVRAGAGAEDE
jgi:anaerobic magnesium-protoporphyrin IX monomethyl ester cyclase